MEGLLIAVNWFVGYIDEDVVMMKIATDDRNCDYRTYYDTDWTEIEDGTGWLPGEIPAE